MCFSYFLRLNSVQDSSHLKTHRLVFAVASHSPFVYLEQQQASYSSWSAMSPEVFVFQDTAFSLSFFHSLQNFFPPLYSPQYSCTSAENQLSIINRIVDLSMSFMPHWIQFPHKIHHRCDYNYNANLNCQRVWSSFKKDRYASGLIVLISLNVLNILNGKKKIGDILSLNQIFWACELFHGLWALPYQ